MLTIFPPCNLSPGISRNSQSKPNISYHWLNVCGISKIMRCRILINTALLSHSVLEILNDAYTTLSLINEVHWSNIDRPSDTQSRVLQAKWMIFNIMRRQLWTLTCPIYISAFQIYSYCEISVASERSLCCYASEAATNVCLWAHVKQCPTMQYCAIPVHTQSMTAYII